MLTIIGIVIIIITQLVTRFVNRGEAMINRRGLQGVRVF